MLCSGTLRRLTWPHLLLSRSAPRVPCRRPRSLLARRHSSRVLLMLHHPRPLPDTSPLHLPLRSPLAGNVAWPLPPTCRTDWLARPHLLPCHSSLLLLPALWSVSPLLLSPRSRHRPRPLNLPLRDRRRARPHLLVLLSRHAHTNTSTCTRRVPSRPSSYAPPSLPRPLNLPLRNTSLP